MPTPISHNAEDNKYNSTEQFHLYMIDTDRKLKKSYKEYLAKKLEVDIRGMDMMMEDLKYKHAKMRSEFEKEEMKPRFDDAF